LLVAIFAFSPAISAYATAPQRERLRELQQQQREAQTDLQYSQNLLQGVRGEIADLMATMDSYAQRMLSAQADLLNIEIAILETSLRIYDAEAGLALARQNLAAQEELFHTRLRAMHEQGPVGFLQVLFQATSFRDFFVQWEHVRAVAQFDQEMLEAMQEAESHVTAAFDDLTSLQAALVRLYNDEQTAMRELDNAIEAQRIWLAAMEYDEEQFALMEELERLTLQAIEEELGVVQRAIRDYETAAERRRQEEAQRQRQAEANARLANLNAFDGNFLWPTPTSSDISSYFGWRTIFGAREFHYGIDIRLPTGQPVVAAADGYVRISQYSSSWGFFIIIDHCARYSTLYAHHSRNRVRAGERVYRGQRIADVGSTGRSTGPHLHFEIRRDGIRVDPMQYFR